MGRDIWGLLKNSSQETTCNASSHTENKTLIEEATIVDQKKIPDHTHAATQTNFYKKKQEVKRLEQTREMFINFILRLSTAFENLENILQPSSFMQPLHILLTPESWCKQGCPKRLWRWLRRTSRRNWRKRNRGYKRVKTKGTWNGTFFEKKNIFMRWWTPQPRLLSWRENVGWRVYKQAQATSVCGLATLYIRYGRKINLKVTVQFEFCLFC